MSAPLPREPLRSLLARAGEASMRHFGQGGAVRRKVDDSPVTDADLAAEAVLVAGLRAGWSEDTIHSEECGLLPGTSDAIWYVDPLDGTSAFTEGLAHWGPTVARVRTLPDGRRRVDMGALYLPRLGEHYEYAEGRAWLNGVELAPLGVTPPSRVIYLPSGFHRYATLDWRGKGRNVGGTAAHLALVARGSALAALVGPSWSHWDTAAGLALIDAVGGRALRLPDGEPLDPFRDEGAPFLAGLPSVVDELVRPGRLSLLAPGALHARS